MVSDTSGIVLLCIIVVGSIVAGIVVLDTGLGETRLAGWCRTRAAAAKVQRLRFRRHLHGPGVN
jgi:hypothetical protein